MIFNIDALIDALFREGNRIKYSQHITGMKRCCRDTLGDFIMDIAKKMEVNMYQPINIIFDGPPSHDSGRFVEVETDDGKSINAGEWIERDDGLWALRIISLPKIQQAG